jgi:protein-S-isoprenylcysteine O-methyltransferase Ste14
MYDIAVKNYIFDFVFLVWMASEIFLYLKTARKVSDAKKGSRSADKGSSIIIALGVTFCITIGFIAKSSASLLLPNIFFYIGILFMTLGIIFRWCAVYTLRQYFSYAVEIKAGHSIVKNGLYRYLRHPAYTGFILVLTGIPLCLRLVNVTLLVLVVAIAIFAYRISIEEKELLLQFGDEYRDYCNGTWRVVPYVW